MVKLENRYMGYILRVKVPIRVLTEDQSSAEELARQLQAHPISINLNSKSQAKLLFKTDPTEDVMIQTEVTMISVQPKNIQDYRCLAEMVLFLSEGEGNSCSMSTAANPKDTEWAEVSFLLALRFTRVLSNPLKAQLSQSVVREIITKRKEVFQKVFERMVRESSNRLNEPTSFKGLRRTVPGTSVNADSLSNLDSRKYVMETFENLRSHGFAVNDLYPALKQSLPLLNEVRGDNMVFLVLSQNTNGHGINLVYLFRDRFLVNICAYYSDEGSSDRHELNFKDRMTGVLESSVLKGFEVLLQAIWSLNPY